MTHDLTERDLARLIRARIRIQGETPQEWAERTGWPPRAVHRYCKGYGLRGAVRLLQLLADLGVELWIVDRRGARKQPIAVSGTTGALK